MTDTIPSYAARTLLTASINHVRHTLAALDHVTLHPHRAASTTLIEASRMDDVTTRVGTPLDVKVPNRLLNRLCDEIGVPRERVHHLRHTAATVAGELSQGDMYAITALLGHSSIAVTTDMYRHVVPQSQRRLSEGIAGFYADPEPSPVSDASGSD
jgi:integrase